MRDLVWGEYCLRLSSRTQIMGIINLTPDSFSGDGLYKKSQITNYPEKIEDFPGLSPRNFFEIPEGDIRI